MTPPNNDSEKKNGGPVMHLYLGHAAEALGLIAFEMRIMRLRTERSRLAGTGASKVTKAAAQEQLDHAIKEADASWGFRG